MISLDKWGVAEIAFTANGKFYHQRVATMFKDPDLKMETLRKMIETTLRSLEYELKETGAKDLIIKDFHPAGEK